jgi:hypothetical protein
MLRPARQAPSSFDKLRMRAISDLAVENLTLSLSKGGVFGSAVVSGN